MRGKTPTIIASVLVCGLVICISVAAFGWEETYFSSLSKELHARLDVSKLSQDSGASQSAPKNTIPDSFFRLDEGLAPDSRDDKEEIVGDQKSIQQTAEDAYNQLKLAASTGDKALLEAISKQDPNCAWCNKYYEMTLNDLNNNSLRSDERAYLAEALARSGRADNMQSLLDLMHHAASNPQAGVNPSTYAQALENSQLQPEAIDQLAADLESENPYLREAALSILTKQGTLSATEQLYDFTLKQGNPNGYYSSGLGIGAMTPQPEALDYLEEIANKRDQYSHLAVKALLNYGREGMERVVAIFSQSPDYEKDHVALSGAVDHIKFDSETISYIRQLSASSGQGAIKEMADQVLREHQMDVDNRNRQIEYNENYDKGIVRN